jgi:hypothetical protein
MDLPRILTLLLFLVSATTADAQELEPRRWGHLPTGANFLGGGYAYTEGSLSFDPVLKIEDATVELHTLALKYIRTFELLGKSARIGLGGAYQDGTWEGLLDGVPARAERSGWADPVVRLAVNLLGAPPLEGQEFADYRAGIKGETIVGAGLVVRVPLGEYLEDKLINLGNNRFTIRPQLGVVHSRGKWSFELTGSAWIFTDNDDFFGGKSLEQDPFFTIQGHVVYSFRPGLWLGFDVGHLDGGTTKVDGRRLNTLQSNSRAGLTLQIPFAKRHGIRVAVSRGVRTRIGADFTTLVLGYQVMWGGGL